MTLLSGGNPQIPKGDGDSPVQAWIAAAPGWKREAAAELDALLEAAVPGIRKAVKWNSPLYGAPGQDGWFLSLHCFSRYIKVAFLTGAGLQPMPPEPSRHPRTRYLHRFEDLPLDQAQFLDWVRQAAAVPGEPM